MREQNNEYLAVPLEALKPCLHNARTHGPAQIEQIRASIREFGFIAPIIIGSDREIIAGHARVDAALLEGLTEVPAVVAEHLPPTQRRAYMIADNKLAENAGWNMQLLADELSALLSEDFDLGLIGFDDKELESLLGDAEPLAAEAGDMGVADGKDRKKTVVCPECGHEFEVRA